MRAGNNQPANRYCNNSVIFRQSLLPLFASSQTEFFHRKTACRKPWRRGLHFDPFRQGFAALAGFEMFGYPTG
jgi:hypothetical protein